MWKFLWMAVAALLRSEIASKSPGRGHLASTAEAILTGLRKSRWLFAAFIAALFVTVGVPSGTAVHDLGLFELDANAVDDSPAGAPDDWETLVGGGGSAQVFNILPDPVESPGDDIFDGGGSKDTNDIDSWKWKGAEPNDKNDIQHAFAAAYENPDDGHLIVYFGLDRLDSSGDAAAGFWFLKKPVEQKTIDGNEIFVYKGTNTPAEHSIGDVLVQSDFTNGGIVERIDAYGWGIAPAGSSVQPGSPLRQIATGADCDVAVEPPELCGQVNDGGEAVPTNWPGSPTGTVKFKGPGGVVNTNVFNDATFLEGGIDLTSFFGNVCVAQFIAETRQSQSETAVLEDKVEGDFKLCAIEVTKEGPEKSKIGDDADYKITIKNTGAVTLYKQSITDTLVGSLTAAAGCGVSLAPDASCVITYSRTVQPGDPDPLLNTVTALYNRDSTLTGDTATDSDDHSVNLFQPSIKLTKTGDALSKIGDKVDYKITLENTSSADTPDLVCTVKDAIAGVDKQVTLASGKSDVTDVLGFEIPAGASDPFVNTAKASCSPTGFPNVIPAEASHSVNLFQPSITFDKAGDTLSKVGDEVTYTLTLKNTSSADTPDLVCKITDAAIGFSKNVTLASGKEDVATPTFTIPAGAADPFPNKAEVACSPTGFPNVLPASDEHTVNLFQPEITVDKEADNAFSKDGDSIKYTVTISNKSSSDSPVLQIDKIADSIQGDLTNPANVDSSTCGTTLALGASCEIKYTHTVSEPADADPLVNTVTVETHPTGFPNDVDAKDSVTVDLVHPKFEVTKVCKAEPISQAGPAVFTITFKNTGDADLHVEPSEGAAFDIAAGALPKSYDFSVNGPFSATVDNTVTGTVTLAAKYALSNSYTFSASDSCDVKGKVKVAKTVSGQPPAAGQTFTFELRQGASTSSDGTVLETKTTDASGNISFTTELEPGKTYQICEWVFPGWNTNLAGDGPLFVPNSIIPPSLPNPNVNNLTVCADFKLTSGQTRTFTVDNAPPPGGRALTIGFWKNWSSCANSNGKGQKPMLDLALGIASKTTTNPPGGLVASAQNPGAGWPNYAPAFYLVLKGDPTSTENNIKPAVDCLKAVNLLNKSTSDGKKKMASDPLFNMTAQLIAAQLNRYMGSAISGFTITNIDKAVLLNGKYKFDGLTYTPKLSAADTSLANCLATQLDNYNNNRPVSAC
jgi:hypothetical protein